jgi:hypothetical protein
MENAILSLPQILHGCNMSFSLVRELIAWRLRWWGLVTTRAVQRHWQWFVLAGALVPMDTPLRGVLLALAYPLLHAFEPGHDVAWHVVRLAAIQLVAALWVLVQRQAIRGGDFRNYMRTLPLTTALQRLVDLALLLPANTVLLAPFITGLLLISTGTRSDGGADLVNIGVVAVLTILVQLAILERRSLALVPILASNVVLSEGVEAGSPLVHVTMLLGALALGLLALAPMPRFPTIRGHGMKERAATLTRLLPPDVRIQCTILAAQPATLLRAASLMAIVIGMRALDVAFTFDGRILPTAALALAALALVMAGWYRPLRDAHAPVANYLTSLPLHHRFWPRRDLRFLIIAGTLPAAAILGPVIVHGARGLVSATLLLLGYWVLIAALRWPLLRGGRQATLLAVLMTGAWSAVAVAATLH